MRTTVPSMLRHTVPDQPLLLVEPRGRLRGTVSHPGHTVVGHAEHLPAAPVDQRAVHLWQDRKERRCLR
eukprot:SAG22_NODE_913_length_6527_cov_2.919726_9_plen_69_part_00